MSYINALIPVVPEARRSRLQCPTCGCLHVAPVGLNAIDFAGSQGLVKLDGAGVHLNPLVPSIEGGSGITLTFRCHHGHRFLLRFIQVHDTTFAETGIVPNAATGPNLNPDRN